VADDTKRRNPEDPDDYDGVALIRGEDHPEGESVRPGRSVFADPDDDLIVDVDEGNDLDLPHWTDPPTGSTRVIGGDDLDAWATITGSQPRWREHAADFDDERERRYEGEIRSEGESRLEDDDIAVEGDDTGDHDFFDFDDDYDDEFDLVADEPAVVPIESRRNARAERQAPAEPAPGRTRPGRSSGRDDMPARVATGLALAAVGLLAFSLGPKYAVVLIAIVLGLAVAELFNATRRAGYQPAVLLGIAASAGLPLAIYWRGLDAIPLVLFLTVAFAMLWFLVGAGTESPLLNVGVTVLGVVYVGVLGSFAALMLARWGDDGIGVLLGAIIATVSYDVGGLLVGRAAGKSQLSAASPNKTVEGLFGGMIATVLVTTVVLGFIGIAPWDGAGDAFLLGVAAAIAAPLGDLCESMIKRDLGVKDMGSILPGHGGLLDRFDALLFVLPITYEIARLLDVGV
jgi:phosphatidate cytidylyltransferase